ncbi:helix-turn-helix domain-containing protein [Actinoplanes sp. NPDC049598]|uniref:helix-turn-helix domain-containing protein n=1 Tax=Actinoplanes sp. NPDC049598 TaxID=3154626 RepID=UPI0034462BE8
MVEALSRPGEGVTDQAGLAAFLDSLLDELPWWDRGWRVSDVGMPRRCSSSLGLAPGAVQVVEVVVPGSLSLGAGEAQLFVAQVRLLEDRLLRWQMKVGDKVVGPALAPAGETDPHPFGAVFRLLVEMRGLSSDEMARRTGRAMTTIRKLRDGRLVPERALIEEVARALDLPSADLGMIAGLDPADPGSTPGLPRLG